jgi:hypothetical protein
MSNWREFLIYFLAHLYPGWKKSGTGINMPDPQNWVLILKQYRHLRYLLTEQSLCDYGAISGRNYFLLQLEKTVKKSGEEYVCPYAISSLQHPFISVLR